MTMRFKSGILMLLFLVASALDASAQSSNAGNGARVDCIEGEAAGFACENVDLLSHMTLGELTSTTDAFGNPLVDFELNDMWGWYDSQTDREFLIVGRYDGTAFVEVTDPVNPVFLGFLPHSGSRSSIWRDMKVYQNHAYIVADGSSGHGMQVFDLTELRSVSGDPVEFSMTAHYTGISQVHNIVINEETGFAYAVGSRSSGQTCGGGLHMIDLSTPNDPQFAGCYSQPGTGRSGTGYTHDAHCVVYHGTDTDWTGSEICIGSNENAVVIADVTDKNAPVTISIGTYPATQYTHQGWLSADHRYYFQGDELDELNGAAASTRTLVWDIQDLDDPVLADEFFAPRQTIDHNMYVVGELLFQSQYIDGLRILDISDPTQMSEVGFFDTHPSDRSVWDGSWSNYPFLKNNVVAVTSSIDGLFLVQPNENIITDTETALELPASVSLLSFYPNPFQDQGTIEIELKKDEMVQIVLVDMLGREIEQLFEGRISGGSVRQIPIRVASAPGGVYIIRVSGESFRLAKTVMHVNN